MTDFEVVRAVSAWGPWVTAAILAVGVGLAALVGAALRRIGCLIKTRRQHSMSANGTSAQRVIADRTTEVAKKAEDLLLGNRNAFCVETEFARVPRGESAGPISLPECNSRSAAAESSNGTTAVGLQPRMT